jgi:hypothetical protein
MPEYAHHEIKMRTDREKAHDATLSPGAKPGDASSRGGFPLASQQAQRTS